MSIERFRVKFLEQRRGRCRIAAKPEEIFESQLEFLVARQQIRRGDSRHFVAQRPHRVKPERFVSGCVRNDVGVLTIRLRQIVIHCVEQQPRDEAPR